MYFSPMVVVCCGIFSLVLLVALVCYIRKYRVAEKYKKVIDQRGEIMKGYRQMISELQETNAELMQKVAARESV